MLQVSEPLENKLTQLAVASGQTVDDFLVNLLKEYEEDKACSVIIEQAYTSFLSSGEASISLKQLQADNDL